MVSHTIMAGIVLGYDEVCPGGIRQSNDRFQDGFDHLGLRKGFRTVLEAGSKDIEISDFPEKRGVPADISPDGRDPLRVECRAEGS